MSLLSERSMVRPPSDTDFEWESHGADPRPRETLPPQLQVSSPHPELLPAPPPGHHFLDLDRDGDERHDSRTFEDMVSNRTNRSVCAGHGALRKRLAPDKSRREVAEGMGLNEATLRQLERSDSPNPSLKTLLAVQHYFGLASIEELLGTMPSRKLAEMLHESQDAA
jgi:DNA-binding XRE family transcriptional regulator